MNKNKQIFMQRVIIASTILAFSFVIFLLIVFYGVVNEDNVSGATNSLDMIDRRLESLSLEINNFPRGAGNDVLFLSNLSSLDNYIHTDDGDDKESFKKDVESDFIEFLKENSVYYQIRYIDEFGVEVVRVECKNKEYKIIAEEDLQNKSEKIYFTNTMLLKKGEVYISPLDLNMENGQIENRGTKDNPVYVPMLRYATPLIDQGGQQKGMVISNVYADFFLDDIRSAQKQEESIFLVNQDGFYMAHPERDKEFSFMTEGNSNFFNDYPEVDKDAFLDVDKRRIESSDSIFSMRYISPTISSFEVYQGSERILGEKPEEKYFWVLVSVVPKEQVN